MKSDVLFQDALCANTFCTFILTLYRVQLYCDICFLNLYLNIYICSQGVRHLYRSDGQQAANDEADNCSAERQTRDRLQGHYCYKITLQWWFWSSQSQWSWQSRKERRTLYSLSNAQWALNYDQSTKIMIMKVKSSLIYKKNHLCYFQHFLCEDRSTASESHFSYVDFLCHMHKVILLPIMFYSTLISFTLCSPMSDYFSKHILFQEIRAMLSWGNGVNDKWSQEHLFQPAVPAMLHGHGTWS